MKTVKFPETQLRQFLAKAMADEWMMTWHEDREISPGVPDLHYVMRGGEYRVGWLELKAIDGNLTKARHICVEPSQHQYLRRWTPHMPIHFLVRILDMVFVIPGERSKELNQATTLVDVAVLAVLQCELRDLAAELPPFLRLITKI